MGGRILGSLAAGGAAFAVVLLVGGVLRPVTPASSATLPRPTLDHRGGPGGEAVAVFAGGCFWGVEWVFDHVKGVKSVTSGYAGGKLASPGYEDVSSGTTGHAESVRVVYDPSQVSYGDLLRVFFSVAHDPTQLNRQGPDTGTQYRSAIFYLNDEQERIARAYIEQLTKNHAFPKPIVTEVARLNAFYPAEAYHQQYALHHPYQPYIVINDKPKVEHLKQQLPELYRDFNGS